MVGFHDFDGFGIVPVSKRMAVKVEIYLPFLHIFFYKNQPSRSQSVNFKDLKR